MSAAVKVGSKMPADNEMNGLDAQQTVLVEDPKTLRTAVVWYDVDKITVDTDTGEHVPTIRLRRFEPLGEADEVSQAIRDTVGEAIEARTGRTPIPFDIVEVSEHRYSDTLEDAE